MSEYKGVLIIRKRGKIIARIDGEFLEFDSIQELDEFLGE